MLLPFEFDHIAWRCCFMLCINFGGFGVDVRIQGVALCCQGCDTGPGEWVLLGVCHCPAWFPLPWLWSIIISATVTPLPGPKQRTDVESTGVCFNYVINLSLEG